MINSFFRTLFNKNKTTKAKKVLQIVFMVLLGLAFLLALLLPIPYNGSVSNVFKDNISAIIIFELWMVTIIAVCVVMNAGLKTYTIRDLKNLLEELNLIIPQTVILAFNKTLDEIENLNGLERKLKQEEWLREIQNIKVEYKKEKETEFSILKENYKNVLEENEKLKEYKEGIDHALNEMKENDN